MTYIVEQTIKSNIYLYEATSYWDKEKKQARQKRKYIGPKVRKNKKSNTDSILMTSKEASSFSSKSFGDTYFAQTLFQSLGLENILQEEFPDTYKDIINLSTFFLCESSSSYLYPYWHEEHFFNKSSKLSSNTISQMYEDIGLNEMKRNNTLKSWAMHINPKSGIYYDITSVSSYSSNIDYVEWGYNRDKESLPQINIGITHCSDSALPIAYNIYPGSITDVTTLENNLKILSIFELKDLFLILDRGFCSKANILRMKDKKISFIQPLSFNLKASKDLLDKHRDIMQDSNAFIYKKELLYHTMDTINLDGTKGNAHVFFNEKASVDFKHTILASIIAIEDSIEKNFKDEEELVKYIDDSIAPRF